MADHGPPAFGGLLRRLRSDARLTQEELADAAGLSPRSVSDLERGVNLTARRDTARLLADALHLTGTVRAEFEAAARGRTVTASAGAGAPAAATRTLPRDIASFTGRQSELQELAQAAAGSLKVVSIHAIGGMAGVGKTAFAVHVAHRLADRYPDGQIFLPLHGHTPAQRPVEPADALASLLLTDGVPVAQVPPGLEARMTLWRDRLAGRKLLLVLDDAASTEQVLPLLPGTEGSLVLVTSRRHLTALMDATAVSLDMLPAQEAAALLIRLVARPGLGPADAPVARIIELCGYLPLAIGMAARQLHHHPAWSAAEWATELATAQDRLDLLTTENVSVATAFNLSYEELAGDQQRLFRRLGLHPGADFDAYAAAALDGVGLAAARRGLESLYDRYLLAEPIRGRYRLHDLLSAHARTLVEQQDAGDDRDRATTRLLDYYQHTAATADGLLGWYTHAGSSPVAATTPPAAPVLTDRAAALGWSRAERANLVACLDRSTETRQHARVVALTAGLAGLLRQDGPLAEAIARHTAALSAARYLGDRHGQATALTHAGDARQATGEYRRAIRDLEEALGIWVDLGDRYGQASALINLGKVRGSAGDYAGAIRDLEQALAIDRDVGDRHGQAGALTNMGETRWQTGDYPGAVRDLEEALGICRDLGDRHGQAGALICLGRVRRTTGDYPGALPELAEALSINRDLGNRHGQAYALANLGGVRQSTGDYTGAVRDLGEALDLFRGLDNQRGQASALLWLGSVHRLTGDFPDAASYLEEALAIYRDIGDRGGEALALNEVGALRRVCGDLSEARSCHQQALELARQIGSAWDEAHALAGLGRCALAVGRPAEAAENLRYALEIFGRTGAAEAAEVTAELEVLADVRA